MAAVKCSVRMIHWNKHDVHQNGCCCVLQGTILDHVLTINARQYTPLDEELIADGTMAEVAGTALDFTAPTRIGQRMNQLENGYDINYNVQEVERTGISSNDPALRLCAM